MSVPFTLGGTATAGTDYSGVTASPPDVSLPGQNTRRTPPACYLPTPANSPDDPHVHAGSTPGGIASLGTPAVNVLTVDEPNPTPMLVSISATSATVGANAVTLTLTGTNFIASSAVEFNGTPLEEPSSTVPPS